MIILTEKPSVAVSFAQALGVPRKGTHWENGEYCIVNALGHLLENYDPGDYDEKYRKWKIEDLPIIPEKVLYKVKEETKAQLAVIKECLGKHRGGELLLATDAEREGEVIGAEILQYAGFRDYGKARRFWVSEALTKEVVLAGIKDAKPLGDYASYKEQGFARQFGDWLTGMNITRFLSVSAGPVLHFGRVQTAVLNAIYEREKAIAEFRKEKYLEAVAELQGKSAFRVKLINKENGEFPFRFPENSNFLKKALEECKPPRDGKITKLKSEKKTVPPPQLFNLTALQKEASRKFSYTPEQTLEAAQVLYEKHKCASYPRTPSRVMGDENAELVRDIYKKLKDIYREAAEGADESNITGSNRRIFNSAALQDHHALIPLAPLPAECDEREGNVYRLILEQFFTALMPPYIYNAVSIEVEIARHLWAGSGSEVVQHGWKSGRKSDDEEPGENYAGLAEGESYPVNSVAGAEKWTEPQKHYTYASLLSLMENPRSAEEGQEGKRLAGLGTPATRGGILKALFSRKYLAEQKKNILITDEGKFLIETVLKSGALKKFVSIPETTRWEEQLHEDTGKFIEGIKEFIREVLADTRIERRVQTSAEPGKCPLCGKPVYEGKKNYYCGGYKEGCKFAIWKETAGAAVTAADAALLLSGKKTKMKKCKSKAGKEFSAAFYLQDGQVKFEFEDRKK